MSRKFFFRYSILYIMALFLLFGCHKKNKTVSEIKLTPVLQWNGMKAEGKSMIGGISDFIISPRNELIALDAQLCQIFFFDKNWKLIRTVGRKGKGPLEFLQPLYIAQLKDSLYVWDAINSRFQIFHTDGKLIKTLMPEPQFRYRPIAIKSGGGFFCGSDGFRSDSLIQIFNSNAKITAAFGQLEGSKIKYYDFTLFKTYTKKRKIPPFVKNQVLLCYTSDHNLFVIHKAVPLLKKFTENGKLIFIKNINSPVFSKLESDFFTSNDSLPANVIQSLLYWKDVTPDESGGIYLLLNNSSKMIVYHYNKNGKLIERLNGPKEKISLIYFKNNKLWAYGSDSLVFYVFNIL